MKCFYFYLFDLPCCIVSKWFCFSLSKIQRVLNTLCGKGTNMSNFFTAGFIHNRMDSEVTELHATKLVGSIVF